MADTLANPGDVLEGQGLLLQHGRLIAKVEYYLAIPTQTHFFINPTGKLKPDYTEYAGGFILLAPNDAEKIVLTEYVLELANKTKKNIRVERKYKKIIHRGQARVSFAIKII